eukprot:s5864_g1.t1
MLSCGARLLTMALVGAVLHWDQRLNAGGSIPQDLVGPLLLQLQAAICVLHNEAQILHLDIKPANILWCAELKELRLRDFGMSGPAPICAGQDPWFTVHAPQSLFQNLEHRQRLQVQTLQPSHASQNRLWVDTAPEWGTGQKIWPPVWVYGINDHLDIPSELPPEFESTGCLGADFRQLCSLVNAAVHPAFRLKKVREAVSKSPLPSSHERSGRRPSFTTKV